MLNINDIHYYLLLCSLRTFNVWTCIILLWSLHTSNVQEKCEWHYKCRTIDYTLSDVGHFNCFRPSEHVCRCSCILCIFLFAIMLMCPPPSLIAATMPLHNRCVMAEQHQCNCPSLCVHFQQQAFNASSAIHHMKKLQSSYSEPSPSPLSLPNIIIQGSQNDLEAPGPRHDDAQALDPNGNRVSNHLSCSSPEARRSLCPPLRGSHSKPDYAHALKEPREVHSFHSESDTPFRPSKRWEELPCSSTSPLTWKSQCNMSAEVFVNCLWSRMES